MVNASVMRSLLAVSTLCAITGLMVQGCAGGQHNGVSTEALLTVEGFAEWERGEETLKGKMLAAKESYKQGGSLDALKGYEGSVREYLDHGFSLYRTYQNERRTLPADLVSSLEQRTNLFMDVADEYIKQGSIPVGESIASEVVRNYSDLPVMAPAQRRAEAVLLRYRYRQDY
jgi:hypothetical protein